MSYCPNCGKENTAGGKFCIHCGTRLPVPPGSDDSRQRSASGNGSSAVTGSGERSGAGREEVIYTSAVRRNIAVCVILSILTLGIYYLIWMCRLNSDINEMSQDSSAPGGAMLVLLVFLTLGIYHLYWLYKMGEKCDRITGQDAHSSIIYLLLGIVGLGIVSYALMQDTINRVLE